jgi:predicted metalloprotease
MRWEDNRESDNVEDRRDDSGGGGMGFGGIHLGLGGIILVLVGSWIFGVNPMAVLGLLSGGGNVTAPAPSQPARQPPANDQLARFVSTILASTEDVWGDIFAQSGRTYERPRLVLFRGAIPTACGTGQSAMGPFYCPQDRKVYIDLGFYQTLRNQLGSPGDFAQAYVIAHELGHHVQNLLGLFHGARDSKDSIHIELQADCLAGAWAKDADHRGEVEVGDIDQALNAAKQIGDDTLQKREQGYVQPETWTHGSSEQRSGAFRTGFNGGAAACGVQLPAR